MFKQNFVESLYHCIALVAYLGIKLKISLTISFLFLFKCENLSIILVLLKEKRISNKDPHPLTILIASELENNMDSSRETGYKKQERKIEL